MFSVSPWQTVCADACHGDTEGNLGKTLKPKTKTWFTQKKSFSDVLRVSVADGLCRCLPRRHGGESGENLETKNQDLVYPKKVFLRCSPCLRRRRFVQMPATETRRGIWGKP